MRRSQPDKDNGKFGLGWSAADDELLRKLGTRLNGETWQQVADAFPARTLRGVKERWRKKKGAFFFSSHRSSIPFLLLSGCIVSVKGKANNHRRQQ